MVTASEVYRRRLRETRQLKGWTQQQLADEMGKLGFKIDASAVTRLERGTRGVTLDEVIATAATLGVSPLHLIVPLDDAAELDVTPGLPVTGGGARAWIRGQRPLDGSDDRFFYVVTPEHDWDAQIPGASARFASSAEFEQFRAHWEREILRHVVIESGGTYTTVDGEGTAR